MCLLFVTNTNTDVTDDKHWLYRKPYAFKYKTMFAIN